ncbi:MAG TPA: hypothetical protein VKE74_22960 [Gemmataceae bacterium]|nr:hypothetical protein [Gemmataceae bacterium]
MAKGRGGRGPSRLDKRREAEAAEARGQDEEREDEEEAGAEDEAEAEDEGGHDEDGAKKKKAAPKKKPATPKKTPTKRVRAQKEVRHKAVWVVFDNSSKRVDTFPFNQKAEAEALLARKQEEKKGTFYLNLVKEELKEEAR